MEVPTETEGKSDEIIEEEDSNGDTEEDIPVDESNSQLEEKELTATQDDNDGTEETEDEEEEDEDEGEVLEAVDGAEEEGPPEEPGGDQEDIERPNEDGNDSKTQQVLDEEAVKNAEASYSTRGRPGETALDILAESSQREAEIQLPQKEAAPTVGPSFLSDSLTEEERRTRTRYLPNVEGMNILRKQEIKSDLALARCMTTTAGVANTLAKKARRGREDDMDVDDAVAPSDEDKASEILRHQPRTFQVGDLKYVFPSSVFLAPNGPPTNGDTKGKPSPPNVVECVAAFNPPRPPESVGPKKKHRMLRWERRPADIEVDLNTYRKTVQKTREELQNVIGERDRIEMLDNHLRRNFLNHLGCLNEELTQILEETAKVQQECVTAADLLTSRTRSRGAGKNSYVMRDVLTILRSRGVEVQEKGSFFNQILPSHAEKPQGVGGVGAESFKPWNKTKQIKLRKQCSGWTCTGDIVATPYGKGEVIEVLPPGKFGRTSAPRVSNSNMETKTEDADLMEVEKTDKQESDSTEGARRAASDGSGLDQIVGPRVVVRLSFGIGTFAPDVVSPIEDPSTFSDARLALRWRGLAETAPLFGETLDIEAMANSVPLNESAGEESAAESALPVDGDVRVGSGKVTLGESEISHATRPLPFGSDLIPTSVGRGYSLSQKEVSELDQVLDKLFFRSACVLSKPGNAGVPVMIKAAEEKMQERFAMKAKLRQLKNEVNRQRRIRQLNQRTYTAAQERAVRIESLVAEMRTDLRSLKRRLDEEIQSLGIDDAEAEKILLSYYNRDGVGDGEESPFKRSRKNAEMDLESEDEEEGEEMQYDAAGSPPTQEESV